MHDHSTVRIAIANDHAGPSLKFQLMKNFPDVHWLNLGTDESDSVDYPEYAHLLSTSVESGESSLGILICGSGNGVCMAANKHSGIRAALCWTPEISALARQHNDANVCCLPARFLTVELAVEIVRQFLNTQFEGGRHTARVEKIPC